MKYSQKTQHAIRFASKTHQWYQDQKRKGKYVPYIVHPLTVGLILSSVGADEDLIIAGILHDTMEDSVEERKSVMPERIEERFGKKVLDLVISVTEPDKNLSWEERKAEALKHVEIFSNDSLLLKSADVLANMTELIDDYSKRGEEVFKIFNAGKEVILQHYLNLIDTIIKKWSENPLIENLKGVESELKNLI